MSFGPMTSITLHDSSLVTSCTGVKTQFDDTSAVAPSCRPLGADK